MSRKRKPLVFGDEKSIRRARCSQRLPFTANITMIAEVEVSITDDGRTKVGGVLPVKDDAYDSILNDLTGWGRWNATVFERDPLGFEPYTDLVYTDDEPRKFYLIQAVY